VNNIIKYLSNLSQKSLMFLSFALVLIIGLCDAFIAPEVGFSFFYLVPIYLSTWFGGKLKGMLISCLSAAAWFIDAQFIGNRSYSYAFVPYWDTVVRLGFYFTIVFLESALKNAMTQALLDPLTLVGNRRYFYEQARIEIQKFLRHKRPFTVAYIDIDDFKSVNDNLGHDAGDNLLKAVAQTIKNNIRSIDIFARQGGDEFVLMLAETNAESASGIFTKLHELLMETVKKNRWRVTFSIGVVTFYSSPDSVHDMIKRVDSLMYSAKRSGKNSIKYEICGDSIEENG
jgi:diguanylate cyclase (GGDEF)-like protein